MSPIQNLPLDIWVIVLLNIDEKRLLETFNKLVNCQAINIPLTQRLDTFWIVVSQARLYNVGDGGNEFPDSLTIRQSFEKLCDMGFDGEIASEALRYSIGNLEHALDYLRVDSLLHSF